MAATGKAIIIDLHRWRNHVMQGPGDVVLAGFTQAIRNRLPTLIAPKPLTLPDRIIAKQRCHDLRIILPIRPTGIGSDQILNFLDIQQLLNLLLQSSHTPLPINTGLNTPLIYSSTRSARLAIKRSSANANGTPGSP